MNKVTLDIISGARRHNYRMVTQTFASQMENQLVAHEQRGRFLEWVPTAKDLSIKMEDQLLDLRQAYERSDRTRIRELTVDIANLLMRFNQLYG